MLCLDKSYLNNLPSTPSLSTPIGGYNSKKLMTDKSANAKYNRVEHVSLLDITIGYEEISISRARLDETIIHTNPSSASVDR